MNQIIYILTNEAMPGYVKIGKTNDLERRVKELSRSTSIPLPFEVFYAAAVTDMDTTERLLHDAFGNNRVAPNREFFNIAPERVVSALKLAEIENVTPREEIIETSEDATALNKARRMRPRFTFSSAHIPIGATITFTRDENITAIVHDDRSIEFKGNIVSITAATRDLLETITGRRPDAVAGTGFWEYEGEILDDRRRRVEGVGAYGEEIAD